MVTCDNDSIHRARPVRGSVDAHPVGDVWCGERYSPHDDPAERVRAVLKAFTADTAVNRPPEGAPCLLPGPPARPAADHRRTVDQHLVPTGLRAGLPGSRSEGGGGKVSG